MPVPTRAAWARVAPLPFLDSGFEQMVADTFVEPTLTDFVSGDRLPARALMSAS